MAVTTSGPALNGWGFRVTLLPRLFSNSPPSIPISAGAWVTFGKYPSRRSTGAVEAVVLLVLLPDGLAAEPPLLPHAATVTASAATVRPDKNRRFRVFLVVMA